MSRKVIDVSRAELEDVLRGSIPMAIATASVSGVSNVTYVSRVHQVDDERIALSNQFLGKTKKNLAENPRASLLAISPTTYAQYRIDVVFERSLRSGPVFERLRTDIDTLAALSTASSHFRLLSADVFRISRVTRVFHAHPPDQPTQTSPASGPYLRLVADFTSLAGRSESLDQLVHALQRQLEPVKKDSSVSLFRLSPGGLDPVATAPMWLSADGVRRAVEFAALRAETIHIDNLILSARYARTTSGEETTEDTDSASIHPSVKSLVVAPVMTRGEVIGVLAWVSTRPGQFGPDESSLLTTLSGVMAPFLSDQHSDPQHHLPPTPVAEPTALFTVMADDGSVFLNHDYLIRGLSGEILAYLLQTYIETGRTHFSNRELRSAKELDIPGLRDNLESRLLELQRRLVDKASPIRMEKTSRGRFELVVDQPLTLDRPQTAARTF